METERSEMHVCERIKNGRMDEGKKRKRRTREDVRKMREQGLKRTYVNQKWKNG